MTADGPAASQGSSAIVSYLLAHVALAARTAIIEEPPIYVACMG